MPQVIIAPQTATAPPPDSVGSAEIIDGSIVAVDIGDNTITSSKISGAISIAKGGTGATDAATAVSNLGAVDLGSAQTVTGLKTVQRTGTFLAGKRAADAGNRVEVIDSGSLLGGGIKLGFGGGSLPAELTIGNGNHVLINPGIDAGGNGVRLTGSGLLDRQQAIAGTAFLRSKASTDNGIRWEVQSDGRMLWGSGLPSTNLDSAVNRTGAKKVTIGGISDRRLEIGQLDIGASTLQGIRLAGTDAVIGINAANVLIGANFEAGYALGLLASLDVSARDGVSTQTRIGSVGGNPGIVFGLTADTSLYRAAADSLKTDDALEVVAGFTHGSQLTVQAGAAVSASTYNVADTDYIVRVTPAVGGTTINLPATGTGRVLVVKDVAGGALTDNITLAPGAGVTIDGDTSATIAVNRGCLQIHRSSATTWEIIGSHLP